MCKELYMVDYPSSNQFAEAYPIKTNYLYDNYDLCPECGRIVTGAYWLPPREVVLTKRVCPDFLYTYCDRASFVISEKALSAILNAGLTGIQRYEKIEFVRFQRKAKKEVPIPVYYHIELVRSRITINHNKSVIIYGNQDKHSKSEYCPLCNQVPGTYDFFRKLAFNMDAYEGYDIFHCYELCGAMFLSQRFVDVCKENNLTNLWYTPAETHGLWAAKYFLDGDETAGD